MHKQKETLIKKTTRSHYEKYSEYASKIGVDKLVVFLPGDSEKFTKAFKEDEHLNNIPLVRWDNYHSYVWNLARLNGIQENGGWSMADTVCLLKHVAIYKTAGIRPEFTEDL